MANPLVAPLESLFWPKGFARDMWAIVDGARDRSIYSSLVNSYLKYTCLYAGQLPPALERAAPYLVQLDFEELYTRRLIEGAWGNNWGIFLRCDEDDDRLRRHLRQFLRVQDKQGRRFVFRYYDPRVMRVYLPTCNSEELRTVFGPIKSFYMEDVDSATALEYSREGSRLATERISLAAPGSALV